MGMSCTSTGRSGSFEPGDPPVDQRPQRQQELARRVGELARHLGWHRRSRHLEQPGQRLQVRERRTLARRCARPRSRTAATRSRPRARGRRRRPRAPAGRRRRRRRRPASASRTADRTQSLNDTNSEPSENEAPDGRYGASAGGRMIVRFWPSTRDDQLEADLLQRDVALLRERRSSRSSRTVVVERQLLGELVVQHRRRRRRPRTAPRRAGRASRARRPPARSRGLQHRHGGEARLHELELLALDLAPGAEEAALDLLREHPSTTTASSGSRTATGR